MCKCEKKTVIKLQKENVGENIISELMPVRIR